MPAAAPTYTAPSKQAQEKGLFRMGRKDLRAAAEGGDKLAKAELARRKANRLAKNGSKV